MKRVLQIVLVLALLPFAYQFLHGFFKGFSGGSQTSAEVAAVPPISDPKCPVGKRRFLSATAPKYFPKVAFLARTSATFYEAIRLTVAHDTAGLERIFTSPQFVDAGSGALVVIAGGDGQGCCQVQVLDGPALGTMGWVGWGKVSAPAPQ